MNTQEIIGLTITDIFVWSKTEVGGLDEAEVSVQLENGKLIGIPWDFESDNIEKSLRKGSESLFSDLRDIPVHSINPDEKTIQEILNAKKNRKPSFFERIKKALGLGEGIPKEYRVYKTEYRENKLKYLRNQKIIDFLMFENSYSCGFLELENGYIITETTMSPHGTGMAGLNYYESLNIFEERCGSDYKRMKNKSH